MSNSRICVEADRARPACLELPFPFRESISAWTGRVRTSSTDSKTPNTDQSSCSIGLHCRNRFVSGNRYKVAVTCSSLSGRLLIRPQFARRSRSPETCACDPGSSCRGRYPPPPRTSAPRRETCSPVFNELADSALQQLIDGLFGAKLVGVALQVRQLRRNKPT